MDGIFFNPTPTIQIDDFDGQRALTDVAVQVDLGPRTPGSQAHDQVVDWIAGNLNVAGWQVGLQETEYLGIPVRNIIGKYGNGRPWVVVGAHYDSRIVADRELMPELRLTPVPGANDGASGVAVLLELARVLPGHIDEGAGQVWFVFFDMEDNGRLPGWDWIIGSQAFVAELDEYPDAAVIVDMIGDADLNVYKEKNSDPRLTENIWAHAEFLGYESFFLPEYKHKILDDHIPFMRVGIPAVDLIDFDYPYYHTLADTTDKVSSQSLQIVGEIVLVWLKSYLGTVSK